MSKGLIAFIVVAAIALGAMLIIEMHKTADVARENKDEILRNFKTIDKSLHESNDRIDSSTQRLIDSLREKNKQ